MEEIKEDGVKIATKEEAFWIELKEKILKDNENFNRNIEINNHVLTFVEDKIKQK
jgi:hypothetical protein